MVVAVLVRNMLPLNPLISKTYKAYEFLHIECAYDIDLSHVKLSELKRKRPNLQTLLVDGYSEILL